MYKDNKSNNKGIVRIPIYLAVAVVAGMFMGTSLSSSDSTPISFKPQLVGDKVREVMAHIQKHYVDDINEDELSEKAIVSILEDLDPHSVYIPKQDAELTDSQFEGAFEGIGIEFTILNDTLTVVAPLIGGPSESAGIISGDKIIVVDGDTIAGTGITNRDVFELLRGEKGSEVNIGIKRNGKSRLIDFVIERDEIPQYTVESGYMINDSTGYIKVTRFGLETFNEFDAKLRELKLKGLKNLILDLQGNPGGIMSSAVNMADEFLPKDKMIVYTDGRIDAYDDEYKSTDKGIFKDLPVVVLIDEGSASASEIVAGALQDNDRALIVGRRSFGKGLVQSPIKLKDGSVIRLTISRYYTPSGRSIQKPYTDYSAYSKDIQERYENGEFFHPDSTNLKDSLEYKTVHGRTVYGGGGIMPDVFVPLDTSMNSKVLTTLIYKNILSSYVISYLESNRTKVKSLGLKTFIQEFEVSDQMITDLTNKAISSGLEINQSEVEKSADLIKLHVKAQIGRNIWRGDGYYPIINNMNESLQSALKLLPEAEKLTDKL
ncbi:S41 family peptidase [Marinigracilibium pacificum]|uniref:S41 family peptidase n=1 Tax=Marinigracilibium pacificum TaxID=2729599 RepID=A0A848IQN0_9BACT|nr:S41 family peptidase [Marinigracilibium pacificum]NMM46763.1 S41 family peptidase [Marinigracilibium pacificum]